jgi:hypothetical protein
VQDVCEVAKLKINWLFHAPNELILLLRFHGAKPYNLPALWDLESFTIDPQLINPPCQVLEQEVTELVVNPLHIDELA